jgi:hypothetical protein
MTQKDQLTSPGDPLMHYTHALPPSLVLVDTPDFDTGAGGTYRNRALAEQSLRAADVLIYIFTNANYNNRDNTDFIARMLTAVGTRKCFLVYRVYPSFSDAEVLEHAATVARNLYGDRDRRQVLGIYRAIEDNRVAAGQRAMTILPAGGERPDLMTALTQMDPRQVRGELHRSIFRDVVDQARRFLQEARQSNAHLELYLESLRTVQRHSVEQALGRLPMDAVVRRFAEIWQAGDPSHIKIMRRTGQVVEAPARLLLRVARWAGGAKTRKIMPPAAGAAMEADLTRAAGRLRQAAVDPAIELHMPETDPAARPLLEAVRRLAALTGTTARRSDTGEMTLQVPFHPALAADQAALRDGNWSATVTGMLARQEALLRRTHQIDDELRRLSDEQRARLTTLDQIRQTFSAMLNIIPATAAVSYVLSTGDPFGAVGVKVKLTGILGLNDLYALVAIPATAGMKTADRKQLEALLGPVARAWLADKLTALEALFEETITGAMLRHGREAMQAAAGRISSMAEGLARCSRALEQNP